MSTREADANISIDFASGFYGSVDGSCGGGGFWLWVWVEGASVEPTAPSATAVGNFECTEPRETGQSPTRPSPGPMWGRDACH